MNELTELGNLYARQIKDMEGKIRADTLPCPEHRDQEAEKGTTYASFPSSYTEYHCPAGHTFRVKVGTTREEILNG